MCLMVWFWSTEGSLKLESRGNGPISSLGNPLRGVDVNLDVHYYKEHAIVGVCVSRLLRIYSVWRLEAV